MATITFSADIKTASCATREQGALQLSSKDSKNFIQALLTPPLPSKNLLKAKKRYEKVIKTSNN